MDKLLMIAVGGAIGAVLRYLSVTWVARVAGDTAFGTLAVNILGSFLLGLFAVLFLERYPEAMGRFAPLVVVGFLGAFTTFSAFSLDVFRLYEEGRAAVALGYAGGSVVLSVAGLVAGALLARGVAP